VISLNCGLIALVFISRLSHSDVNLKGVSPVVRGFFGNKVFLVLISIRFNLERRRPGPEALHGNLLRRVLVGAEAEQRGHMACFFDFRIGVDELDIGAAAQGQIHQSVGHVR
jgi:hypothetical protein